MPGPLRRALPEPHDDRLLSCLAAVVTLRFPFGGVEHEARLAKLAVAEAEAA